jgi:hypothetical protein
MNFIFTSRTFEMCLSAGAGCFEVVPCSIDLFLTNCSPVSSDSSAGSEF